MRLQFDAIFIRYAPIYATITPLMPIRRFPSTRRLLRQRHEYDIVQTSRENGESGYDTPMFTALLAFAPQRYADYADVIICFAVPRYARRGATRALADIYAPIRERCCLMRQRKR